MRSNCGCVKILLSFCVSCCPRLPWADEIAEPGKSLPATFAFCNTSLSSHCVSVWQLTATCNLISKSATQLLNTYAEELCVNPQVCFPTTHKGNYSLLVAACVCVCVHLIIFYACTMLSLMWDYEFCFLEQIMLTIIPLWVCNNIQSYSKLKPPLKCASSAMLIHTRCSCARA